MPRRNNNLLIQDIYESGQKIFRYTENLSFEEFLNDEKTVDAVIRNFEIIGEASRNITQEFADQNQQIPWRVMVGYRNFLIHEYFGVSLKIVWDIIQNDLPSLMNDLSLLLKNNK